MDEATQKQVLQQALQAQQHAAAALGLMGNAAPYVPSDSGLAQQQQQLYQQDYAQQEQYQQEQRRLSMPGECASPLVMCWRSRCAESADVLLDTLQHLAATLRMQQQAAAAAPSETWAGDAALLHDWLFQAELIFQRDGIDDDGRCIAWALSHMGGAPRTMAHAALGETGSYAVGSQATQAPDWLRSWDGFAARLCSGESC